MTQALFLPAPAKVNLGLRVLGRRPDGYHELDTVFHALALADDLVAQRTAAPEVTLELAGDTRRAGLPVPSGDDNLVVRAGRAWLDAGAAGGGLRFWLRKRIPAGGGLGGGSSDAAAALRLAAALAPGSRVDLRALALGLGADVSFFLIGDTARGRGVGERLEPVEPAPRMHFALVLPPFGTPTREVFENLDSGLIDRRAASSLQGVEVPLSRDIAMIAAHGNDLEPAAFRIRPALAELCETARAAGVADLRLSGSGSTLFVARADAADADDAADRLRAALPHDVGVIRTGSGGGLAKPRPVRWEAGHVPELDP